ncbi:MAG: hypothetical protein ABIS50_25120 [Luteolibacter sp.]|uniref:hypothetical protein n=1 Tax=Luteolibacter sp. TaxID=1962973 RepID=UPI003262D8A8
MKSIPAVREKYRPLLDKLPPLPPFRENRYELHMLCGHRDTDMGIWASWSIMRFLDGQARLYVHSDGTLTEEDGDRWRKIIGEVRVIDRNESDVTVERELAEKTTHLYPWRCSNWASAQLVDIHFFGEAPTMLIMDSDVLTFSKPQEVIDALSASPSKFAWCKDLRDAYSSTPEILQEITGARVPQRLCAGFLVCPRLGIEDFVKLDDQMRKIDADPRVEVGHFWSCQTYYALVASRFPGSGYFSDLYSNTDGQTNGSQVLRHFVGIPKVRFRYFTEGLARIAGELGMRS